MSTFNNRLQPRNCHISGVFVETIYRPAQHHFDLIKSNIADGCTSTTSIFDEDVGDVPTIFRQGHTNFELAQELLDAGANADAQRIISGEVEN